MIIYYPFPYDYSMPSRKYYGRIVHPYKGLKVMTSYISGQTVTREAKAKNEE